MLKVYFDDVLVDDDSYTALTNDYKLFTDSFKLGSVACNSFKLSVNKAMVENHPNQVKIEDDNTTFYLTVDSITEDKYVYNYTLVDKLINFNFNYDASIIINTKKENEETCYLSDIWHDMCDIAGVEYDDTYTFLNDIAVDWHDNTIQARKYLSYIAELQAGYATILDNGKQSFKPYKKASSKTINIDECSDFILGEKKTITRVVYDNGINFWAFGNETGTTVYLDPTNVFITSEEVVENIYNAIVGFEFYLVDVPQCPIDSTVRAGDVITFTDGTNEYPTIAQYSTSFNGAWVGGYKLQVKTDRQEETNIQGQQEKILKIQSEIDRTNASLTVTAQKTNENTSKISDLEITTNNINQSVTSIENSLSDSINQVISSVEQEMNSKQLQINVINETITNGVSKVVTNTGYTFDNNGLTIEKNNKPVKSNIDESGLEIADKSSGIGTMEFYSGYVDSGVIEKESSLENYEGKTIVYTRDIIVKEYIAMPNGRFENVEDTTHGKGIGLFI